MASDIIARGMAAKAAGDLSQFKEETTEALAGKADLQDGKVPASQLPSYVDDVVEYASVEAFPATGELGKIYVAMDTGYTYRWAGSDYIQIGGQDLSDIVTSFAQDYDSTATYAVGDFCTHENVFYVCSTAIDVAEAWNADHWTRTTVATVIEARDAQIAALQQSVAKLGADLASPYDPTLTYKVGDLVMVEDELWKCVTKIETAEAWNPTHWVKVNLQNAINDMFVFPAVRAETINVNALTDEQIELFRHGVAVKGSLGNFYDPIFYPCYPYWGSNTRFVGIFMARQKNYQTQGISIRIYDVLNGALRMLEAGSWNRINIDFDGNTEIYKAALYNTIINGKGFPAYPSDTTKPYALEQDASTGALAWNEKLAYGFRRIPAPASTTLTNDEVELFKQGVIIDGTFLSYTNPVFYPASGENNAYHGIFIGTWQAYQFVRDYYIENNVISIGMARISFGQNLVSIDATTVNMNGKTYPTYPTDLTKSYALEQNATSGALAWNEKINNLAPEYDATATYAVGDVVMHDGRLYECTTAIAVAEAWDASHWNAVTVGEELAGKVDISQATDVTISDERVQGAPNLGSITVDGDPYNIPQKTSDLMNDSGFMTSPMTEITWAALKELRDNGNLIPGMQYRITDYQCTTTTALTHSANHQFDIIVVADSASVLNEKARAALHAGDTYFANSNLAAWQLWYLLDNNQSKYAWADPTNGKGVIYRMIDEFNNDVPYDFKNIVYEVKPGFNYNQWGSDYTFARDRSLDADGYYGWRTNRTPSAWSNSYCFTTVETPTTDMTLYSNASGSVISYGGTITSVETEEKQYYTFTSLLPSLVDCSIRSQVNNNVILQYVDTSSKVCVLNRIYMTECTSGPSASNNLFDGCHDISMTICRYSKFIGSSTITVVVVDHSTIYTTSNCDVKGNISDSKISNCSFIKLAVYSEINKSLLQNCTNMTFDHNCRYCEFEHCSSITVTGNVDYVSMKHCIYINILQAMSDCTFEYNCAYLIINSQGVIDDVCFHHHITGNGSGNELTINVPSRQLHIDYYAAGSQEIILGGSN